jgi:hypothetical protein
MNSANGKIPTGSSPINLSNIKHGESKTYTSNIEKCPDKSANLNYTVSFDFLRNAARSVSGSKQNSLDVKLD